MAREITITNARPNDRDKTHGVELNFRWNDAQTTVVAITRKELTDLVLLAIAYLFNSQPAAQPQPEPEEDDQCTASSWRGRSHRPYGPGDFNRCNQKGKHEKHVDDFGNVFVLGPPFRVVGRAN